MAFRGVCRGAQERLVLLRGNIQCTHRRTGHEVFLRRIATLEENEQEHGFFYLVEKRHNAGGVRQTALEAKAKLVDERGVERVLFHQLKRVDGARRRNAKEIAELLSTQYRRVHVRFELVQRAGPVEKLYEVRRG